MRARPIRYVLAAVGIIAVSCTKNVPVTYQGYVEGEFVHVGAGVGGRLEIWDRTKWDTNRELVEQNGPEFARQLGRYGI